MSKATFTQQGAPPALPAAGRVTLYAFNNIFYSIDDVGTITPLAGGAQDPTNYLNGFDLDWTTAQTITLNSGTARSSDDTFDILLAAPVIIDIGVTGAVNGLDSGIENPNAWYAVHAIDDSSGSNAAGGLFSLSPTAPTLPAGYDKFRFVGWVRNHTGDFIRFVGTGVGRTRSMFWDNNRNSAPQRVTSGGAATIWSTVNCSVVIPPQECLAIFNIQQTSGTIGTRIRRNGGNDPGGNVFCRQGNSMQFLIETLDQQIQYENTGPGGAATIDCVGFQMPL